MELESIMQSEISQVVWDKYHMISTLTGTEEIEEKRKQNITRDIEVKNNLTMVGGSGEGTVRRGDYRNIIKDTWTKSRGRGEGGREGGSPEVGWRDGEKRHTTVNE